jgi:hypothetical protein
VNDIPRTDSERRYSISPRTVALLAGLTSIALMTGLIVVAAVRNVDVLATVALVLAIVAFVIQIIVFISQSWAAERQANEGRSIYSDTRSLLSRLEGHTQATQSVLVEQNRALVEHLINLVPQTLAEVRKETPSSQRGSPDELRRVRDRLRAQVERERQASSGQALQETSVSPRVTPSPEPPEDTKPNGETANLRSWPSEEEAPRLAEILNNLSPLAVSQLSAFGEDELRSREAHLPAGLGRVAGDDRPVLVTDELTDAGLVEDVDVPPEFAEQFVDWSQLTPLGREVARMLLPSGPVPDYILRLSGRRDGPDSR